MYKYRYGAVCKVSLTGSGLLPIGLLQFRAPLHDRPERWEHFYQIVDLFEHFLV